MCVCVCVYIYIYIYIVGDYIKLFLFSMFLIHGLSFQFNLVEANP